MNKPAAPAVLLSYRLQNQRFRTSQGRCLGLPALRRKQLWYANSGDAPRNASFGPEPPPEWLKCVLKPRGLAALWSPDLLRAQQEAARGCQRRRRRGRAPERQWRRPAHRGRAGALHCWVSLTECRERLKLVLPLCPDSGTLLGETR